MAIELDWMEGDDQPGVSWEEVPDPLTAAPQTATVIGSDPPTQTAPNPVRKALLVVGVILLIGAVAAAAVVFWRAGTGNEQARLDLEAAIQSMLSAQENGNPSLYGQWLDDSNPFWRAEQLAAVANADRQRVPVEVTVASADLTGTEAIAELIERYADGTVLQRQASFRLSNNQWRLAPPQPNRFGEETETETAHFRILAREQDEALLGQISNLAEGAFVTLCGNLRCQHDSRPLVLLVAYGHEGPLGPYAADIVLPSPQLAGITSDGNLGPDFQEELVSQLARRLARAKAPNASPALLDTIADWALVEVFGEDIRMGIEPLPDPQSETLMSLNDAWRLIAIANEESNGLAQAEIRSLLLFAEEAFGDGAVGRLLEASAEASILDQVVRQAFDIDLRNLQARWQAWLSQASPSPPGTSTG